MKEKYIELLRSTNAQGIEEVIKYLEESGFFKAPASTSFHLNYIRFWLLSRRQTESHLIS